MSPTPSNPMAAAAPLPPLPNFPAAPNAGQGGDPASSPQSGLLAGLLSGLGPLKQSVDQINQACKMVVQSGVIPGAEQVCGQIVALANSLVPMGAQSLLQPGGGMGQGPGGPPPPGPGGLTAAPPPPGGPAPMMG